ncbi:MAG TPA: N-methyl-L-tryptophan oxidase [Solirubrobacteraceae bacterium]
MGNVERADVIVVGLGAMGSAVTLRLARRGLRVIAFDQFEPPHDRGSTHGETRITRLAIGEGADFVPLVVRSHELWRELEQETGTRLLHQTGGLVLGEPSHPFLNETRAAAVQYGIAHRNLSSAELKQRFPMFGAGSRTEAYLEPAAGYVRPEAAVAVQLSLAEAAGAQLHLGEAATAWDARSAGVTVTTSGRTTQAAELVLCAGPWITKLWPDAGSMFAIQPQCLHWFPICRGHDALAAMPIFIWGVEVDEDEFAHGMGFYGFPAIDGPHGGVKLATEVYGTNVDPDGPWRDELGGRAAEFYGRHVAQLLPWLGPEPLRTVPCLYTSTRGSRFITDRHPDHANVMLVSACSGHGFKHSAAIGEAVAETVATGETAGVLKPFGLPAEL